MWTVYLLVALLLVVVVLVGRLLVRLLWRGGATGRATLAVGTLLCGWALYRALVPSPQAYLDEFAHLTGVSLPASTEVIARAAGFPDRHGRYQACFIARLPAAELAGIVGRLGTAAPGGDALGPCGRHGQATVPGAALSRYHLAGAKDGEQASVRITVDAAQGWLRADWSVRRQLIREQP